jgi:hypothetical protein
MPCSPKPRRSVKSSISADGKKEMKKKIERKEMMFTGWMEKEINQKRKAKKEED